MADAATDGVIAWRTRHQLLGHQSDRLIENSAGMGIGVMHIEDAWSASAAKGECHAEFVVRHAESVPSEGTRSAWRTVRKLSAWRGGTVRKIAGEDRIGKTMWPSATTKYFCDRTIGRKIFSRQHKRPSIKAVFRRKNPRRANRT